MIITYQQIQDAAPCGDWLEWFRENIGQQTADIEWTPAAQGLLLADPKLRRVFGWLVWKEIIPMWSMHQADLTQADLQGATLYGADLTQANLRGANLYGANLQGANLTQANLTQADLSDVFHDGGTIWPQNFKPAR